MRAATSIATPGRPGFTLLETLVVLVILAAVIGLVIPSVARVFGPGSSRDQVVELRGWLAMARSAAIESGAGADVILRFGEPEAEAGVGGGWCEAEGAGLRRRWDRWSAPYTSLDGVGRSRRTEVAIRFAADGRCDVAKLRFGDADGRWVITFHPVTGWPAVELGEAAEDAGGL